MVSDLDGVEPGMGGLAYWRAGVVRGAMRLCSWSSGCVAAKAAEQVERWGETMSIGERLGRTGIMPRQG